MLGKTLTSNGSVWEKIVSNIGPATNIFSHIVELPLSGKWFSLLNDLVVGIKKEQMKPIPWQNLDE